MIQMPSAVKAPLLGCIPVAFARRSLESQWWRARRLTPRVPQSGRLFIDVSVISREDARTGIQRVVRSICSQLLKCPPSGYEVQMVVATRDRGYCVLGDPLHRLIEPRVGDTLLALDLAASILPCHWDLLARWKRRGVSVQAIVYDLLPVLHPEWFTPRGVSNFRRWLKTLALFADRLHCISNVVKSDVIGWLSSQYRMSHDMMPISVFSPGCDIPLNQENLGSLRLEDLEVLAFARRRTTAMMVGTVEPRKSHAQVLDAFDALWAQGGDEQLLVVGIPGWKTEAIQQRLSTHPRSQDKLLWVRGASDELLVSLYQTVGGVIAASEGEGLGLPVLEAICYKRPLLARDMPVFREVASGAATFFPDEPRGLSVEVLRNWFDGIVKAGPITGDFPNKAWSDATAELIRNMELLPLRSTH